MPLTPHQAATDGFDRARAAVAHAKTPGLAKDLADDLARTAVVVAVGALDTYLHACVLRNAKPWKPKPGLARLDLRFDVVCELVLFATEGRSKNPKSRPWVLVKEALQDRLLKATFQSSRAVEEALGMCGVKNGWSKVAKGRKVGAESLKKRLDAMVHRRNRIVHESDLQRTARPRAVQREDVDPAKVARDIEWLAKLVDAIDHAV